MEMRPGEEMDGVKKEIASEITNPPGGGPCSPARPGLSPYVDFEKGEVIIPQDILNGSPGEWVMREGKILFIVRFKEIKDDKD